MSASTESLTRVIAPSLGGLLLGKLSTAAPGVFSGILLVLLLGYVWIRLGKLETNQA
jgi:DHA1 family tetracycline resistance protein-like MFS transporter